MRTSFITGRIPIRSALSIVVALGGENYLRPETPTIAEFFKKNGYTTYFSGKWHLGDKPVAYPTSHGFDEMKEFAATGSKPPQSQHCSQSRMNAGVDWIIRSLTRSSKRKCGV